MSQDKISTAAEPIARYNLQRNWLGHDMETFVGRLQHWFKVVDPRNGQYGTSTLVQYKKDVDVYSQRADHQGFAEMTQKEFQDF